MKNTLKYILGLFLVSGFFACEGPLELDPAQSIDSEKLIVDAASANVAMNGLYSNAQDLWGGNVTIIMDISSDVSNHIGTFTSYRDLDESNPFPDNTAIDDPWRDGYALIYNANVVLAVVPTVNDPALDANQLLGEARALRAWSYFYLANMYGDVPLIQTAINTVDEVNVTKTPEADIYNFVIGELNKALGELGDGGGATRITKGAVHAMLAKAYAATGQWGLASDAADDVVDLGYMLATNYMDLFNGSISSEAIFQLDFNSNDQNSLSFFYWDTPGGRHEVGPSQYMRDLLYQNADDARSGSIIDAPSSPQLDIQVAKYSDFATGSDKPILLRLADILLIKAEALAREQDYGMAQMYFDQVRTRSNPNTITLDANNYEDVILEERAMELAWEGGHRWLDLQRTGRAADVVTANGQDACKAKWPIPRAEIDANTAMVQNPCY